MKPKLIQLEPYDAAKFFPIKSSLSEKPMFTDISLYSTTPVDQSLWTAETISSALGRTPNWIVDANACIGGNTWSFAQLAHTTAIELEPIHVRSLQHNLNLIAKSELDPPMHKIDIIEGNCVPVLRELMNPRAKPPEFYASIDSDIKANLLKSDLQKPASQQNVASKPDVIFVDPPWGGIDYKKEKNIVLSYRYERDYILLHDLLTELDAELLVAKLPHNYNFDTLAKIRKYHKIVHAVDPRNNPLYSIVFMSNNNIGPIDTRPEFERLGYKKMKILNYNT